MTHHPCSLEVSWRFITSVLTVRSVMQFDLIPMHNVNLRTDLFYFFYW